MKWSLLYLISFLLQHVLSIRIQLKSHFIDDDFTLSNKLSKWLKNISYSLPTINLCFGKPPNQCFNLVISLMGYTIIEQPFDNSPILSKLFYSNDSSTFEHQRPFLSYGFYLQKSPSYYISGDEVNDIVTFPNETPRKDVFKFILLKSKKDYKPLKIEGFLGLRKYSYTEANSSTNCFLVYLQSTTQITKLAFSLMYNSNGDGLIAFGEDEKDYKSCSSHLVKRDSSTWSCALTEIQFGEDNKVSLNQHYIEFDSVKNYIIAPFSPGNMIFELLINVSNNKCKTQKEDRYTILFCDESVNIKQFPNIHLRMNEAELVLQWSHLLKQDSNQYISLLLVHDDENQDTQTWTLGIPGFIDSTFIFDKENETIGFIQSLKKKSDSRIVMIMIMIIMMVVLLVGISLSLLMQKKFYIT